MLKKLVIPFFVIAAAFAFTHTGCDSSSSTGTAGTSGAGTSGGSAGTSGGSAGTSGGSAGTTAAAGTTGAGGTAAGGTTGAGGTAAGGTTGTAGRGAGGTTGAAGTMATDGGAAGTMGGGRDGGGADAALPACTSTTATSAPMSAADFCAHVIAKCTGIANVPAPYLNQASCETMYTANTMGRRTCQSYHLCWGVEGLGGGTAVPGTHCPHAAGTGPCAN